MFDVRKRRTKSEVGFITIYYEIWQGKFGRNSKVKRLKWKRREGKSAEVRSRKSEGKRAALLGRRDGVPWGGNPKAESRRRSKGSIVIRRRD
jgi:hypothetical protein